MRYAQIRNMDVSNGVGPGVSLFVQGCDFHCKECFNSETWDFNGGEEWTEEVENKFLKLINRPYIKRVSILGGEPLHSRNVEDVRKLICKIKERFPDKKIWLYTGYTWEESIMELGEIVEDHNMSKFLRSLVIEECDVLVEGRFDKNKKDLTLKFRGSSNQRIIDVQKTINSNKGEIILWEN